MNEEQLIEFINWLPTAVPEFQDASPEQIVQTLNQLYESEEGQATLSQLFTAFQESKNEPQSQMFKKGGKLDQLTQKAKKGKKICCKKKEIVQGGMVNKIAEKMQNGGELATGVSANTLKNFITKGQTGLITPEVKPSGIRGLFWRPTEYPRIDSGVEGNTRWTGTRSAYYNQDGDLIQSITKQYQNGPEYTTTMEVKAPFTPVADTTFINTGGDVAWGKKTPEQLRNKKDSQFGNVFNRVMSGLQNNILVKPTTKDSDK